jgi:hypothetical protein
MTMPIDERSSLERYEDATNDLVSAQTLFQKLNHELKRFEADHGGTLTAEQAAERESLLGLQQEALANLEEKVAIQKFAHHEIFAQQQGWGRSSGKWWRNDKKHEDRGKEDI